MMASILVLAAQLAAPSAEAADFKLGTVDYNRAMQEIEEGKQAQARLDKMYAGEKARIDQLETELRVMTQEYQSKQAILSDVARKEYEEKLYTKQMEYQQAYMAAEQQMQMAYFGAVEQLMKGLKEISQQVGTERGYDLILEGSQGTVLYAKPGVDLTDEVIRRYNVAHPPAGTP